MKISKVFTGLVVCGVLMFPGALTSTSSAKELNSSISSETINFSSGNEEKQLVNTTAPSAFIHGVNLKYYEGETYYYTMTKNGKRYSGTLYYQSKNSSGYWYTGWMAER
ncbi:hypothetical protein I6G82_04990 [Lysinibacillus macroides]|nr:hypothetical protein [Lysinibacillus macroides]QPR68981.1 hypothetical protein I6G82_04990 [Lysinibacillus macroides]